MVKFYVIFAVVNLTNFLLWTYVPLLDSYDTSRTVFSAVSMFMCGLCVYAAYENYMYYTYDEPEYEQEED